MEGATVEIQKHLTEASKLEVQSLDFGRKAVAAFADARKRSEAYQSSARSVQSEQDTKGVNARLKAIANDGTFSTIPGASEAAARTHVASIQYSRVYATQSLVNDMRTLRAMNPKFGFDESVLVEELGTSINDAKENLAKASEIYNGLKDKMGPQVWATQTANSAAKLLESLVLKDDEWNANPQSLADARSLIQQAFQGRDKHPLMQGFLPYRDHLGVSAGASVEPAKNEEGDEAGGAEKSGD